MGLLLALSCLLLISASRALVAQQRGGSGTQRQLLGDPEGEDGRPPLEIDGRVKIWGAMRSDEGWADGGDAGGGGEGVQQASNAGSQLEGAEEELVLEQGAAEADAEGGEEEGAGLAGAAERWSGNVTCAVSAPTNGPRRSGCV